MPTDISVNLADVGRLYLHGRAAARPCRTMGGSAPSRRATQARPGRPCGCSRL